MVSDFSRIGRLLVSAPWFDVGSLIAGMVVGIVGALAGLKLKGKAPPKGDDLRK